MNRILLFFAVAVLSVGAAMAQIGYQVTVFDPATKAPKANQTVSASVTISDSAGKTICTESISGTTDEYGILSMTVGGASTFANVDWSKLPLWISASVDGVTISKTQVLNVPVSEFAKKTGTLTKQILCSKTWETWNYEECQKITFSSNGTCSYVLLYRNTEGEIIEELRQVYNYYIDGNTVVLIDGSRISTYGRYIPQTGRVYFSY